MAAREDTTLVRQPIEADFDEAADLIAAVYVGEGYSPAAAERSLRNIRERAASAHLLIALLSDHVFGAVFLVFDGPLRQIAQEHETEVRMLCVDPARRRRGIAKALMNDCESRTRHADRAAIALSTQPTMRAAQTMYAGLGYVRDPQRDWERERGQPMLAFVKQLE